MAVDVEVPVQNGMGGILVKHVADVYRLPEVLKNVGVAAVTSGVLLN